MRTKELVRPDSSVDNRNKLNNKLESEIIRPHLSLWSICAGAFCRPCPDSYRDCFFCFKTKEKRKSHEIEIVNSFEIANWVSAYKSNVNIRQILKQVQDDTYALSVIRKAQKISNHEH
jgi:hypothetical protein